jgi:hypothetical protein
MNGARVVAWAPPAVTSPVTPTRTDAPTCPKHCDTATPPEHGGGDHYVCVCCGTEFRWKGSHGAR